MKVHTGKAYTKKSTGITLIEVVISLAILAVIVPPLFRIHRTLEFTQQENQRQTQRQLLNQAIEAFVLTYGRLPCPSANQSGHESRSNQQCTSASGLLPWASLGLATPADWTIIVADLSTAGTPAAGVLHIDKPLSKLSSQQINETILAPITSNYVAGQGPLPAIHVCQIINGVTEPDTQDFGCGSLPLISPAAVLAIWPTESANATQTNADPISIKNTGRVHQILINPDRPTQGPIVLSLQRLNWLWVSGGWLQFTSTSSTGNSP